MEGNKKRSADAGSKSASPKKQRADNNDSKVKRNRKKMKDGPKRPMTAYLRFARKQRLLLAEKKCRGEDVPCKMGEQSKLFSQLWSKMSDEEKSPFVQQHMAEQEKYRQEVQKLSGKDENKPKRPMTAFIYFLRDFRKRFEGCSAEERKNIPKLAGEKWGQMTVLDKKSYNEMAEKAKKQYIEAMNDYKQKQLVQKKKGSTADEESGQASESEDEEEEEDDDDDEEEEDDDDESD